MVFGKPLPEHRQSRTECERFQMLLRTDPTRLDRAGLIRVLKDCPETVRPPRFHQLTKADLLAAVQKGLQDFMSATVVAPLIRREVAALSAKHIGES
jgi:hypothetical protein